MMQVIVVGKGELGLGAFLVGADLVQRQCHGEAGKVEGGGLASLAGCIRSGVALHCVPSGSCQRLTGPD